MAFGLLLHFQIQCLLTEGIQGKQSNSSVKINSCLIKAGDKYLIIQIIALFLAFIVLAILSTGTQGGAMIMFTMEWHVIHLSIHSFSWIIGGNQFLLYCLLLLRKWVSLE